MFFYIPTQILVFKPNVGIASVSQLVLVDKFEKEFSVKNDEGKNLFEVTSDGNKITITWSNKLNYSQLISIGVSSWKRAFILRLDENKHVASLSQKDVDWSWGATVNNLSFSGSFFKGISIELKVVYKPSFIFNDDGSVSFDVKKLKYSSDEIMQPLLKILLDNGWTVRLSII